MGEMRICLEEDLEFFLERGRKIGALSSSMIFGVIALLRLLDFAIAGVLFLEPFGRPRPRTLSRILERGALSSSSPIFATGCVLTSGPNACAAAAIDAICGPTMGSDAAAAAAALGARLRGRLGSRLAARLDLRLAALLALADRATEVALADRPPMTK